MNENEIDLLSMRRIFYTKHIEELMHGVEENKVEKEFLESVKTNIEISFEISKDYIKKEEWNRATYWYGVGMGLGHFVSVQLLSQDKKQFKSFYNEYIKAEKETYTEEELRELAKNI